MKDQNQNLSYKFEVLALKSLKNYFTFCLNKIWKKNKYEGDLSMNFKNC